MTPISKELSEQIEREAEAYARYRTHTAVHIAYRSGATEYGTKWERAKKALQGILQFCENNGEPVDGFRFREEAVNAKALLTSWKEEGKEEADG